MPATPAKRAATERASAKHAAIAFIAPQLATLTDDAPVGPLWLSETKFDGYRMQAHCVNNTTVMYSRNALDWSHKFPDIRDAVNSAFAGRQLVLDGEIVVAGKVVSSFHALQSALSAEDTGKARYMVFDLLYYDGLDLRSLPLSERRSALETLFAGVDISSRVQLSKILRGSPATLMGKACTRGEEGIICKRKDSIYASGRSHAWVKVKCGRRQEFVVVGYSEPKGSRTGVGALLLGVYEPHGVLRYAGRVGTGFSSDELHDLRKQLEEITVVQTPLHGTVDLATVKESGKVKWVRPDLVAEISFTEWTSDGLLRHPVYQGLREDKKPTDVKREDA